MDIKKYQQKRNFKKSDEPKGKIGARRRHKKLYIIQKHDASHLHYDFRLELNGVLLSWAVPKGPSLDPAVKRLAVHVEDHPLEYGQFEGVIASGQYGAGTVMLWDKGEWVPDDDDPLLAYTKGHMTFTLKAVKLNGRWKLIRINRDDKTWLLIKDKDKYAKVTRQYDITREKPDSVLSHLSLEDIPKKTTLKKNSTNKNEFKKIITGMKNIKESLFPKKILPQLATLVDEPPSGNTWLHEVKFDGYRILAFKQGYSTRLSTRNQNDWTNKFKMIADTINTLAIPDVIFDGEIVVLDDRQHSNFQLLQNAIQNNNDRSLIYYIFDILYYDKNNLMTLPLIERKKILKKIFTSIKNTPLRYSDHIIGSGKKIYEKSCQLGLEGIVSKNVASTYIQKRGKNWLKIKCLSRQEFVIGGYMPPQRSRQFFGSLLLGTYNKEHKLVFNGKVGTGFTDTSLKSIYEQLQKNKSEKMPFQSQPPDSKNAVWVKPVLVVEVEFIEWTRDNLLRHPSFKGLRKDKPAKNIIQELEVKVETAMPIKLSHPDKIIYKEDKIDKQALVEYYQEVQKWILPYIENRPLTLLRCPGGYKDCFYQKHLDQYAEYLHQIMIKEKHKNEKYFYLSDQDGLFVLPQLSVLEIHAWNCSVDDVKNPDMLVFDLDPAPNLPWKKIVSAAIDIKMQLEDLKLRSFVKTTGGKGLHVVVPILPEYNWNEVKNFAHAFVNFMVAQNPKNYTATMAKSSRTGKIFIDYLRNQRGATSIAPYSTRAIIHAPVAVPLSWDELTNDKRDTYFTLKTISERLRSIKKDPWASFFKVKQSLRIKELINK